MCINVVKGTTNPALPFYTPDGSFFMNGTTRFLATVSEQEKGQTRNVCNQQGYESVALVPIRANGNILGIIHVADRRENRVPLETVQTLERKALPIGVAVQRILADEALRLSEEKYRGLFENAVLGMYQTTPDGEILMANPALVRMLGYDTFEQLTPRKLEKEGFDPEHPRSLFKDRIEADGQIVGLESAWKRRDGSTLWVRESARAVRDEAGKTLFYEGTVEDITERERAEEEVRQQLDELRRWHDVTIRREGRIAELKREVNALAARLGEPPPYQSEDEPHPGEDR
jgi:PAS domain S-box-containing protein